MHNQQSCKTQQNAYYQQFYYFSPAPQPVARNSDPAVTSVRCNGCVSCRAASEQSRGMLTC